MPLEQQQIHSLQEVIIYCVTVTATYFYTAAQNVPIHFDEVQCTGAERSLGQCNFITDHDCDHSEDAGVICIGNLLIKF